MCCSCEAKDESKNEKCLICIPMYPGFKVMAWFSAIFCPGMMLNIREVLQDSGYGSVSSSQVPIAFLFYAIWWVTSVQWLCKDSESTRRNMAYGLIAFYIGQIFFLGFSALIFSILQLYIGVKCLKFAQLFDKKIGSDGF